MATLPDIDPVDALDLGPEELARGDKESFVTKTNSKHDKLEQWATDFVRFTNDMAEFRGLVEGILTAMEQNIDNQNAAISDVTNRFLDIERRFVISIGPWAAGDRSVSTGTGTVEVTTTFSHINNIENLVNGAVNGNALSAIYLSDALNDVAGKYFNFKLVGSTPGNAVTLQLKTIGILGGKWELRGYDGANWTLLDIVEDAGASPVFNNPFAAFRYTDFQLLGVSGQATNVWITELIMT